MSNGSSSAAAWSTLLEPYRHDALPHRADDPRLGEVIEPWSGDLTALRPGRPVLLGFPQDEGVRRNHGRTGAAEAPNAIRHWLDRLTVWEGQGDIDLARLPPLDLGNLRIGGTLEDTQAALGEVVWAILQSGAIPIILGGGHETAYGHYLGYVASGRCAGIINLDAHLDIRPLAQGQGHSGTPFRQALEHPRQPLPGPQYVCLGAQPHSVSQQHLQEARQRGCVIRWCDEVRTDLAHHFSGECERLAAAGCQVYVSIDADVVHAAEVPGVSAPNVAGLSGREVLCCARRAGRAAAVSSLDLVEINPRHDVDGRSARWAALVVWHFLAGLVSRVSANRAASCIS
jgi:formiminoglutamase